MMTPAGTHLIVGQIWIEVDPRKKTPRYVRIVRLHPGRDFVWIETVESEVRSWGNRWSRADRTRITDPKISRFHGKRGGYALFKQVEP